MTEALKPFVHDFKTVIDGCDVIVLAAGFEDRAFAFLDKALFSDEMRCVLIKFVNDIPENERIYELFKSTVDKKIKPENIAVVEMPHNLLGAFYHDLERALERLPRDSRHIWIDISGLPSHAICSVLRICRDARPNEQQEVIYTSAKDYHPTKEEFEILKEKQAAGVEYLPNSMALEMAENLIPESFSGHRTNDGQSCLALFAGYEVHRSAGVIENINPSTLLLLFGRPEGVGLEWRLDLSRQLHNKFQTARKTATEVVSTLDPGDALKILDEYYKYLSDDYDLTIAPVCSKMHCVAAYLFWERYKEVQLTFPLPIGYATAKRPIGVDVTYRMVLEPKSSLHRESYQLKASIEPGQS